MTDGVHHSALVGGSNCGRVIACPPSRLSGVPVQDTGTQYTERGTVLHNAMEVYLATGAIPDVVQTTPIIGEMREAAEKAVELWEDYLTCDPSQKVRDIHIEMKLHMVPLKGAFGTSDVVIDWAHANMVTILDWKFGVQMTSWSQLMFYAACALYDKQTKHLFNRNTIVELAIIQPSAINGETFRSTRVTVDELFDFIMKLKWAVDNGHRDELLNVGEHCRFCPVKVVCPKINQIAQGSEKWNDPFDMTPDQVGEALAETDILESRIKALRDYVHERLNNGEPVTGYKLVNKRAQRKWNDVDEVLDWIAAHSDVNPEDIMKPAQLLSPAQVEKKVKDLPENLYSAISSGTTIAPDGDKRQAIVPGNSLESLAKQLVASDLLK